MSEIQRPKRNENEQKGTHGSSDHCVPVEDVVVRGSRRAPVQVLLLQLLQLLCTIPRLVRGEYRADSRREKRPRTLVSLLDMAQGCVNGSVGD